MRKSVVDTLVSIAATDERVLLLTGDLGFMALEPFAAAFPKRFVNVGVAEQNMIGLATGLAESGFIPFVYSIATFAALRPYEFIRNGPILHRLPVRILGMGGGFEYGIAGPTHHGLEDVGVFRTQPEIFIMAPADYLQARSVVLKTWSLAGPIYYRLGKNDRDVVPGLDGRFEVGRAELVRPGTDVVMIAMGAAARQAALAAEQLATRGVSCAVMVLASVTPSPTDDLVEALSRFSVALTVEAHYISGGIGSLVAEIVAERRLPCRLVRCGVRSGPSGPSGSEAWLNRAHGISADRLVERVLAETASS